jgi:hypothetical protein
MKKRDKIIYWISTIWLALGMTSTGGVQLLRTHHPGYLENLGGDCHTCSRVSFAEGMGLRGFLFHHVWCCLFSPCCWRCSYGIFWAWIIAYPYRCILVFQTHGTKNYFSYSTLEL